MRFFTVLLLVLVTSEAYGFCGFFVSKANTSLFNKSSKVVLVRDEDKTVLTMVNDYQGDPKEFAMVIPVPVVLKEKQINVGDNKVVDHLDGYTAPRLVEYFDSNPCAPMERYSLGSAPSAKGMMRNRPEGGAADGLGVKIEAEYQVGEYDIKILSAKQSDGLLTWLNKNGYKTPASAKSILKSYVKRDLKFFVAKVNLKEREKSEFKFLRPLQIAYESKRFDLPIRLGTVNANGPQDLFIFALTKSGRVETTNYTTKNLPTDTEIPTYVKEKFGDFYKSMFSTLVKKDQMKNVYVEYAWDMSWCDPCAADPLNSKELRSLGVWWVEDNDLSNRAPNFPVTRSAPAPQNVFATRLHVRYDAKNFPDDLRLNVTGDKRNFQGRFVLRHPYTGDDKCEAMKQYKENITKRNEQEAQNLASLTGWEISKIREEMKISAPNPKD